jgi:Protein of unknown function (DUF3631)
MTKAREHPDGAQLLGDLSSFTSRFVKLTQQQADLCALWAVHTHAMDAFDFTPYLDVNSAVLRSGKTRLLEVLRLLVFRPWFTGRVTASALVRKVDKDRPTLLLDESDAAFQTKGDYGEALRGILNTGFERDGTYSMCVQNGNDWEPRDFKTFYPKAIAGIGQLPETVRDRSIPIQLKRARQGDGRQRFRKAKVKPEADQLRQRIEEWAKVSIEILRQAQPELPEELNDRQQDVCEPLLAIADLAGNCWPERARAALVQLCAGREMPDDSTGLKLLADIRDVFAKHSTDRLPSSQLLERLRLLEESPWGELDHGRPLSAFQLSRLLKPFDVRPHDIRFNQSVQKGYLRSDFEDAWERYLAAAERTSKGQQGQQASVYAGPEHFSEGQQESSVADQKNEKSPIDTRVVADVAPSNPPLRNQVNAESTPTNGRAPAQPCYVHPENRTDWWCRRDGSPVCGLCTPNPATI